MFFLVTLDLSFFSSDHSDHSFKQVVAQLVEQSFPLSEVLGLNPVIGKLLQQTFICLLSAVLKNENKEKEAENGPLF